MEHDGQQLQQYLTGEECDSITLKINVPSASRMGGDLERQIRSVKNMCFSIKEHYKFHLNNERLKHLCVKLLLLLKVDLFPSQTFMIRNYRNH